VALTDLPPETSPGSVSGSVPGSVSGSVPEPARPRGLAALRDLIVDDEGGSAAVEFIVLVPVYIVLLAGLFSMAQVMHVRQQVVAAARFEAWNAGKGRQQEKGPESIREAFFGIDVGQWQGRITKEEDVDLSIQGGGRGATIATKVLQNEVGNPNESPVRPLRLVEAEGEYRWSGLSFLTGREMLIGTWAAVMLTNDHERPIYEDEQDHEHVMLSSQLGRTAGAFDPLGKGASANPILNPVFGQFPEGSTDPGVWNTGARLGGNRSRRGDVGSEFREYNRNGLR
jgi:hypothetical protein